MHSHTRSHHPLSGMNWSAANVALTSLFPIFLFLLMTMLSQPAQAQSSAPATARQAATMPQYAARLAHPAPRESASRAVEQPRASYKNPGTARVRNHRSGPLQDNEIYDNGPINGTTDAWTINGGFVVSDTFVVGGSGATVGGMSFGAWLFPGDVLQAVEISISSQALGGGTIYGDQVVNFTQSGCSGNQYGFNICTETSANFTGPNLAAGTYWVNLQNAVVNTGDPVYWDENSGVGCGSQGCPSEAEETSTGTIPSEAFTLDGGPGGCQSPPCPCFSEQPQNGFQVIHDFGEGDGNTPADAFVDSDGNLYGKDQYSYGYLLFKLVRQGADWLFKPLSVLNPWDGDTFGPNGSLYGATLIEYNGNDGSVLNLQPPHSPCLTGCPWSDPWTENSIYNFQGNPDASIPTGVVVFDREGNIYGTALHGGGGACTVVLPGCGAVYELTPTSTGWTEKVIYGFPGGADTAGVSPWALLVGVDGNLYGLTGSDGEYGYGTVYRLKESADGWTRTILYSFSSPQGFSVLLQDSADNLYGIDGSQTIFSLTPSDNGWVYTALHTNEPGDHLGTMVMGIDGNLYGTGGGYTFAYIFALVHTGDGWQYSAPVYFNGQSFPIGMATAVDPAGNVYGLTVACGKYNDGTIWEFSP